MKLKTVHCRTWSVGLGLGAVVALAGLAPTMSTFRDRFTDNTINTGVWQPVQIGNLAANENRHRLEFATTGATGQYSYAGLAVAPWGANWKQDFLIQLDYNVNLNSVAGDRIVWVGVDMSLGGDLPDTTVGYAAGVSREHSGTYLAILRFDGNGPPVQEKYAKITASSGTLVIEWSRDEDRLAARADGKEVFFTGVWSRFGASMGFHPMLLGVGCTTLDGNVTFPGTRVYADNFEFTGVKKAGCAGCH